MNNKSNIQIIYNKFCPYALRALITAIEKDLPIQFIKTGLGDQTKTPYFIQTYAKALGRDQKVNGKVPVLVHNGYIITESQLICWYLAEQFDSGSALIPKDSYKRAKMRYWINGINAEMISIFDRAKFRKVQSIEDFLVEIDVFLAKVDKTIEGEYLLKDGISLADLMIYPWFERWVIIEHYFGFSIPEKYLKIHKWLKNMNGRRSILQTKKMTDSKYYIERTAKMRPRL